MGRLGGIEPGGGVSADELAAAVAAVDLTAGGTVAGELALDGRLVLVPATQTITAVSDTILPAAAFVQLTATGAAILTSTPNIATAGVAGGTELILHNAGTNTITLQDESTLAGSKLRLASGTNKAIGPNDVIALIFDAASGFWRQKQTQQALT